MGFSGLGRLDLTAVITCVQHMSVKVSMNAHYKA
jgi:hypothetical protein